MGAGGEREGEIDSPVESTFEELLSRRCRVCRKSACEVTLGLLSSVFVPDELDLVTQT